MRNRHFTLILELLALLAWGAVFAIIVRAAFITVKTGI